MSSLDLKYFHCLFYWETEGQPKTCRCRHIGEAGIELQPIRNYGTRREKDVSTTPRLLYPLERAGTCRKGGVNMSTENSPPLRFDPQTVPSRYTDRAMPTHRCWETEFLLKQDCGKTGDQCPLPPTSLASGIAAVTFNTPVRRL